MKNNQSKVNQTEIFDIMLKMKKLIKNKHIKSDTV